MDLIAEVRLGRSLPSIERARSIRVEAGATQGRIAELVGVHRVTLARWEAGSMKPRGAARARYAEVLAELQHELAS